MEIGDTVELKSGGPAMTVVDRVGEVHAAVPRVTVVWMDASDTLKSAILPVDSLDPVDCSDGGDGD